MTQSRFQPLWRILSQLKEYYALIFAYSVCISLLTLAPPISVQSLVSTFSFGPHFQPIFILSVILLGLLTVLGIVKTLQYLLVEYLQRKLYAKVTANISRAYLMTDENKISSIRSKANRYFDIVLVHKKLAFLVTDGIAMSLQTFFGLILISLYHPFFIVFSFFILLSIFVPLYLFGGRALYSATEESKSKYEVADFLKTLDSNQVRQTTDEELILKTDKYIGKYLGKRTQHFKTVFLQNIIYITLYALINALLLALGGYLVISNQLSIGQLVAAEIVVNAIISHFLYASKYLESFYDLHAASKKIDIFFEFIEQEKRKDASNENRRGPLSKESSSMYFKRFKSISSVYMPSNYKKIIRNFGLATLAIVLLLTIVPWQQFSRGQGSIIAYDPNDRVQKITAPINGIVEEWLVQDGQFVKKGDPIVRIVDNDPNYLTRLETNRDASIAKFEAAKEASDTGRLNFHRQEQLVKEGLSSPREYEMAKITYKKLRSEEASAASALAKSETELSRQQQIISAPRNGRILRVLVGSGTTNVKAGEALLEFVPTTEETAVEIFVDGNDLPLVYPGRKVRLQFEGWPAVQFSGWPSIAIGSFGGVVSVVDPSVGKDGMFRILVQPDPEDKVEWPSTNILRQGTRAVGIALLDEVTVGYEIWRQINGFPKSTPTKRGRPKNGGSK